MKYLPLSLAFALLAAPVFAAAVDTAPLMVKDTRPAANRPAQSSKPASANANGNQGAWTSEQVDKLCYSRATGDARRFDSCKQRNQYKVGRPKQPGEMSELNLIDKRLAQKTTKTQP